MPPRPRPSTLTVPLLASLLLHLGAGALGVRWSFNSQQPEWPDADKTPADPPQEEPPGIEPDPIRLGLSASTATSLTWLGFDKYQDHIAKPSEVDQPELAMDPPTGPPTESLAVALVEPSPPMPEVPAEQLTESTAEESNPIERDPLPQKAEEPATEKVADETETPEAGETLPPITPPPLGRGSGPSRGGGTPHAPIAPTEPTEPTAPAGSGSTGQQSDRESIASSILTAEWKKLGRPLAAQGLEIKTRRPKFTQYTRIMGAARNPIVRVHFRRDGRVERVDLVQSSGNADVDRPVIDAIYLWRAAGEPLNRIPTPSPPATYPVEFRILM